MASLALSFSRLPLRWLVLDGEGTENATTIPRVLRPVQLSFESVQFSKMNSRFSFCHRFAFGCLWLYFLCFHSVWGLFIFILFFILSFSLTLFPQFWVLHISLKSCVLCLYFFFPCLFLLDHFLVFPVNCCVFSLRFVFLLFPSFLIPTCPFILLFSFFPLPFPFFFHLSSSPFSFLFPPFCF